MQDINERLMQAAAKGDKATVQTLIHNGADVNHVNNVSVACLQCGDGVHSRTCAGCHMFAPSLHGQGCLCFVMCVYERNIEMA